MFVLVYMLNDVDSFSIYLPGLTVGNSFRNDGREKSAITWYGIIVQKILECKLSMHSQVMKHSVEKQKSEAAFKNTC